MKLRSAPAFAVLQVILNPEDLKAYTEAEYASLTME